MLSAVLQVKPWARSDHHLRGLNSPTGKAQKGGGFLTFAGSPTEAQGRGLHNGGRGPGNSPPHRVQEVPRWDLLF